MRFGHYAVAPFLLQRFLIPVYEVSGVQELRLLGRQNITTYTPAIDLSPTRIKRLSFLDQLDIKRYLASTRRWCINNQIFINDLGAIMSEKTGKIWSNWLLP